jgi:F-type H+-transporting ATPase subunit b
LTRTLRQLTLVGLFGVCLAGFAGSGSAWALGLDSTAAAAGEEEPSEPAHALLFKVINFVLLVGGLGYVLRKPAADFFRSRSASIQKGLEEGRKALEASQVQLRAVEEKLQHLEEEIAAFRASAAREIEAEHQRLQQATAEEAARILESASAQMDTAVRGARLELKNHAARQAVTLAEGLIRERLDEAGHKRLVSQFAATLQAKERKN